MKIMFNLSVILFKGAKMRQIFRKFAKILAVTNLNAKNKASIFSIRLAVANFSIMVVII